MEEQDQAEAQAKDQYIVDLFKASDQAA